MENKPQVIFIHGGDAFRDPEKLYAMLQGRMFNPYDAKKKWQELLFANLADTHECHRLSMPNSFWADYKAWKIWFEKMVPYLRDGVVLVGHSLGGSFLFRYLTENKLPVTVGQVHLIAPVILPIEDCEGFYINIENWSGFMSSIDEVHVWHSSDDLYVPMHHAERLAAKCPSATTHYFTDRGHFLQSEFPELLTEIKK